MITLYCGIGGETTWNYHPVAPGPLACISPVHGNRKRYTNSVPALPATRVLQDSGAFSDKPEERLDPAQALERQIRHAEVYGYTSQVNARASYDCLLIDEIWEHGRRRKERWPEEAGWIAVQRSVEAARYLSQHRGHVPAILSAQGVSPQQYLACVQQILPPLHTGDYLGLGGWCIVGKVPGKMMPIFRRAMHLIFPLLAQERVQRVHIWGMLYPRALGELLYLCDEYGIELSTDNAGAAINPAAYGSWGYGSWRDASYEGAPILETCKHRDEQGRYAPTCPLDSRCRGLERTRHVALTRDWLLHFRTREAKYYRYVPDQINWLEEVA